MAERWGRAGGWRGWAAALALVLAGALPGAAQPQDAPRPATLIADRVAVDAQGRLVAEGSVEVWQGSTRLTARRVIYDQANGRLDVTGPLTLSEGPDRIVLADAAQLSDDLREGLMASARIVLHQQLQIAAAAIARRDGRLTRADAVVASSCEVCAARPTPLWEIRAARVTHDQGARRLWFDQAQFRLAGVPLAYLPRLSLPDGSVDRARGFLFPDVRVSSDLGVQLTVPYFIPLGPARDLTLSPTASTEGMAGLGFRWRQAWATGGIEAGGQVSRDRQIPGRLRGYGYLRGLFGLAGGFRLSLDAIAPSDRRYLETYGITDESRLRSHLTLERYRRDEAIRARVVGFRSLRAADDNDRLPNRLVDGEWERRLGGLPVGGELTLAARLHAHHRASDLPGADGRDVARAALFLRWQRREVLAGGVLATLALRGRLDQVRIDDDPAYPDPISRAAAEAMVELRWPLARVDGRGGQHLLEPVVQWIGARRSLAPLPNDDHLMPELDGGNLFAPLRYAGLDAPDDGSRIHAGLRWVRHDPAGWSVETLAGRIWRRDPLADFGPGHIQPLGAQRSDWLLAARLTRADGGALGLRLTLDEARRVSRGEVSLNWTSASGTGIVSRYHYVPANPAEARPAALNEVSVDLSHRFDSGWRGTLGWDYDVGTGEWGTARGGLEFRNECLAVDVSLSRRFATSTNLTPSTRFGVRVQLLGLTGRSPGPAGRFCRA